MSRTSQQEAEPWTVGLEYSLHKSEWQPERPQCSVCSSSFSLINRVHHCRRCGLCICDNCSGPSTMLPGYVAPERVCRSCDSQIQALRTWMQNDRISMTCNVSSNVHHDRMKAWPEKKDMTDGELWLSETMCMVMWTVDGGNPTGMPLHLLERIDTGVSTGDLHSREISTSCFCISSKNEEFEKQTPLLFTLVFQGGKSVSFSTRTSSDRAKWTARWDQTRKVLGPVVKYHFERAKLRPQALIDKETERWQALKKKPMFAASSAQHKERHTKTAAAMRAKYSASKPLLSGDDN